MLWTEDLILPSKRVWCGSQRYDYLQGAFREISITFKVAEEQAARSGPYSPGCPAGDIDGYSPFLGCFCLYCC